MFYKFLLTNLHKSTQGKLQKSMRSPILIRIPCYSKSFITTSEEESLGNQAKRDYDFTAATVKLGFMGRKYLPQRSTKLALGVPIRHPWRSLLFEPSLLVKTRLAQILNSWNINLSGAITSLNRNLPAEFGVIRASFEVVKMILIIKIRDLLDFLGVAVFLACFTKFCLRECVQNDVTEINEH